MKAVFFDVDDTLYNQRDTFQRAYDELFGNRFELEIEKLFLARQRRSDEVFEASQIGAITMEEMYIYRVQKAFEDLGFFVTPEESLKFQELYVKNQQNLSMPQVTRELLDTLKRKGIALGVITNGPFEHQWKKVNALNLLNWMPREHILISGEVGITKPDRGIFDLAKERTGLKAEEMWFVGDSYENDILGAKGAGWHNLWVNRRGKDISRETVQPEVFVMDEAEMSAWFIKKLSTEE